MSKKHGQTVLNSTPLLHLSLETRVEKIEKKKKRKEKAKLKRGSKPTLYLPVTVNNNLSLKICCKNKFMYLPLRWQAGFVNRSISHIENISLLIR